MKNKSSSFLQIIIAVFGIVVLFLLIRMPLLEGRAKDLDLVSIYTDPLILYGYAASIVFFVGLYRVFKLVAYFGQNEFSNAKTDLKCIKYCAITFGVLIMGAAIFISQTHHKDDDPAGFIGMSIVFTFISMVVAFLAARFEKRLTNI